VAAAGITVLFAGSLMAPWPAVVADPPGEDVSSGEDQQESQLERMWANAGCYVCHTTFVHEELGKVHLEAGTGCIDCHGPSAAHANDEDVGATPPDITYARDQIDASCAECHEGHNVPARLVIARWIERRPPGGDRSVAPVCTDCHGSHSIPKAQQLATHQREGDGARSPQRP